MCGQEKQSDPEAPVPVWLWAWMERGVQDWTDSSCFHCIQHVSLLGVLWGLLPGPPSPTQPRRRK